MDSKKIILIARILNNIIAFLLVLSTGGLLFVFNRNISFLVLVLVVIFSLVYIGKGIKSSVYYSSLLSFLAVVGLFIINFSFAITPQSITKYLFFGIIIFTSTLILFYFNNQDNKNTFISSLYFVLKLFLFHSLFNFVLYFFVKNDLFLITSDFHESLTYNYLCYYSTKSGSLINLFGLEFQRNIGLFWEPGILQAYLNILFFLEVTVFKRSRLLLVLIIIAILLTYSTTGLMLLMIQIIYFLYYKFKKNIAVFLMILIGLPLYMLLSVNMNEKIYGERELSFQKRLIDLTQPFFIALEHPITGVGLDIEALQKLREGFYINYNINEILDKVGVQQKLETTSKAGTNSVMSVLASMGFPTTILFLLMFIKQKIITNHKLMWFVITFVSVMSEPLLFRPFFFILIISGFYNFFYQIINHKKQIA